MIRVSPEFIAWLNTELAAEGIRVVVTDPETNAIELTMPNGSVSRYRVYGNCELAAIIVTRRDLVRIYSPAPEAVAVA